jgi:hypothetical protein
MKYDPLVRDFMLTASKLLKKGARKKDPALMWAILQNLEGVIDSFTAAAEEQYLVSKLEAGIEKHEKELEKQALRRIER